MKSFRDHQLWENVHCRLLDCQTQSQYAGIGSLPATSRLDDFILKLQIHIGVAWGGRPLSTRKYQAPAISVRLITPGSEVRILISPGFKRKKALSSAFSSSGAKIRTWDLRVMSPAPISHTFYLQAAHFSLARRCTIQTCQTMVDLELLR